MAGAVWPALLMGKMEIDKNLCSTLAFRRLNSCKRTFIEVSLKNSAKQRLKIFRNAMLVQVYNLLLIGLKFFNLVKIQEQSKIVNNFNRH
jgi:hypothetical protein